MTFLQRAFLLEYLAEPPERYLGEVENRFGWPAIEKNRLLDFAHKAFNILLLEQ